MAEVRIEDEIAIDAPAHEIWSAIKDPAAHVAWHPFVARIRGEHRLGATRTCTVVLGKRTGDTKERCIGEAAEQSIVWAIEEDSTGFSRMVSDWRAGFRLDRRDAATVVTAESAFRPRNALVRLMTPILRRKFHQTQQAILTGLKAAVELPSQR